MNKKDLIPVILLALLIPVWMYVDRAFIAPKYPAPAPAPTEEQAQAPTPPKQTAQPVVDDTAPAAAEPAIEVPAAPPAEEIVRVLGNDQLRISFTSIGGGIKNATLLDYPEFDVSGSPPVELEFPGAAALSYEGLSGIGTNDALNIQVAEDGRSIEFSKAWNSDTVYQRTISMEAGYVLKVRDRFANQGRQPWTLPALRIRTGRMGNPADTASMKGMSILGVDSYTPAGGINYWGRKLTGLYKEAGKPVRIDAVPEGMSNQPVEWVATKNKFFVQVLSPANANATMSVLSRRDTGEKAIVPHDIAATLDFQPVVVEPGETHEIEYTYYVGPKDYSLLKEAGNHFEGVMEFETIGFWSFMNWLMEPARKFLLWTMNRIHAVIPNYGIAIILMTLLVRILFWPLTHKSTESMRRMQEIQPEIKAIQAKYKKDPQRMQQETMKLYKEKKVNPMGGCLPMFVQIPVFIALYTVLRNAIELRYASFLWISDLSSPENLFAGKVPFVGALNILPIIMAVSMIGQQKMTTPSTAATPEQQQQQKMMMIMMPIMMLFFFYSMPSGLVLYWTTSNLLMIGQTALRNFKKKREA